MKTNIRKIALLCLLGLWAAAVPAVAQALESSDPLNPIKMDEDKASVLAGAVIAKTDKAIVVQGKSVLVTPATSFSTRDGSILSFDDVNIGDEVRINTSLNENSQPQAVSVEVLKSQD